ncbi:MAG: response regulator [Polyangiaceae bacterium]
MRPKILCVDDEPMLLKSMMVAMRKHFEVIPANSAAEAFDILERDPELRVVVSDYKMPRMDGGVFLDKVRERFPSVIRILLSGAGAEDVTDTELVFRFLSKPCPRDAFISAIEEALAQ